MGNGKSVLSNQDNVSNSIIEPLGPQQPFDEEVSNVCYIPPRSLIRPQAVRAQRQHVLPYLQVVRGRRTRELLEFDIPDETMSQMVDQFSRLTKLLLGGSMMMIVYRCWLKWRASTPKLLLIIGHSAADSVIASSRYGWLSEKVRKVNTKYLYQCVHFPHHVETLEELMIGTLQIDESIFIIESGNRDAALLAFILGVKQVIFCCKIEDNRLAMARKLQVVMDVFYYLCGMLQELPMTIELSPEFGSPRCGRDLVFVGIIRRV